MLGIHYPGICTPVLPWAYLPYSRPTYRLHVTDPPVTSSGRTAWAQKGETAWVRESLREAEPKGVRVVSVLRAELLRLSREKLTKIG